ncbi:MAG: hypothetical protein EXS37_08975 [Opitutus sp.]|nr:hypothetical protein [Opitutus sp.]
MRALGRAVARDDVDVVEIALPTHLHHDIAVAAARAGKHLYCEKPARSGVSRPAVLRRAGRIATRSRFTAARAAWPSISSA